MVVRNGIAVEFSYDEHEKKKYEAAGKALHKCKEKNVRKGVKRIERKSWIRDKREPFQKFMVVLFFMIFDVILLLKSKEKELAWEPENSQNLNKIGLLCIVLLIGMIVYFSKSKNHVFGCSFREVFGKMVKNFFKSIGVWIGIAITVGVLAYFVPKGSPVYVWMEENLYIPMQSVMLNSDDEETQTVEGDREMQESGDILQNEYIEPEKYIGYGETSYENCAFVTIVDMAKIYVDPTDGSHMYEAYINSRFIATGKTYTGKDGSLWYEFHIDDAKKTQGWIKDSEISFQ